MKCDRPAEQPLAKVEEGSAFLSLKHLNKAASGKKVERTPSELNHTRMKRLFVCFGFAAALLLYTGCDQHDTSSPDTSGSAPYGAEGANKVGIDTISTPQNQAGDVPDMENGTKNNMQEPEAGGTGSPSNRRDTVRRQQ